MLAASTALSCTSSVVAQHGCHAASAASSVANGCVTQMLGNHSLFSLPGVSGGCCISTSRRRRAILVLGASRHGAGGGGSPHGDPPARPCANDRSVFDLRPNGETCSLQEAREAKETCSSLEGKARDECFASFGCNSNAVDAYLDEVVRLEEKLPQGPDVPGNAMKLLGRLLMGAAYACFVLVELVWSVASSVSMSIQALFHMLSDALRRARWPSSASDDPIGGETDDNKIYTFDAEHLRFREYHGQGDSEAGAARQQKQ